jgi:hypothetical protein
VQGFYRWHKAHIKISKGCPLSQMVRYKCVWTKDGEKPVYLWSSKGRLAYKAQWGFLQSTADGLAMVRVGLDAIQQASNASWFKCLEGSMPFF